MHTSLACITLLLCITLCNACTPQYEYKVKGIRKVRVFLEISTGGVKVFKRKGKRVSIHHLVCACINLSYCY